MRIVTRRRCLGAAGVLLVIGAALGMATVCGCQKNRRGPVTLKLYAGAGLNLAVDDLVAEFQKETGVIVEPDYGGSGMLLSRAQLDKDGDLFMPGDVWYVDQLHEKTGLIDPAGRAEVVRFTPVIIVARGNPKHITGLKDFFRDDVKPAIGNPSDKGPRIGQIMPDLFRKSGLDAAGLNAIQALTVNELGTWVATNHADAAVVWNAIALALGDRVQVIEIPADQNIVSSVVIGIMKTSRHPQDARRFVDFVAGPKGREVLRRRGYQVPAP